MNSEFINQFRQHPALRILAIVWFVIIVGKGFEQPSRLSSTPFWVAQPTGAPAIAIAAVTPVPTVAPTALPTATTVPPSAPPTSSGDPVKGKELFIGTCAACHGPMGEGVKNLGKDMTTSQFIAGLSDEELLAFIKKGRDPSDPLNTTGVAMLPKGGNPTLDDAKLLDIIAFIRSIHKG